MSESNKRPPCPACGNPLKHSIAGSTVSPLHSVHCPNPRCTSEAAWNGADGITLELAVGALAKAIEKENHEHL